MSKSKLNFDAIKELADGVLAEMRKQIQEGHDGRASIASGNLIRTLDYQIILNENGEWNLIIEYADYGKFVDKGRNPGRMPPSGAIENWMRIKGIPHEALWPILQKIKFGGFYSRKLGVLKGEENGRPRQQSLYSRPEGINFTDALINNEKIKKLQASLVDYFTAELMEIKTEALTQ